MSDTKSKMKYVLVTGGVISGIGKGVISSSIGAMLKACNLRVTSIKIDPYLNIDAGTFSPYEHDLASAFLKDLLGDMWPAYLQMDVFREIPLSASEVFVLDDGGEVDLDLGNYERFLDAKLHKDNNITTGKIYKNVIEKERRGDYLGQTVQVVPHITDAIQEWVQRVATQPIDKSGNEPDLCIIELGGVTGDIEGMPYVEAFRQFQFKVGHDNICVVHVSLIPETGSGELKTKPTQMSVRELRGLGLTPDLIMCRSKHDIDEKVKQKISMFCHVNPQQVVSVPDVSSVYRVPLLLHKQGLVDYFTDKLKLQMPPKPTRNFLSNWKELADRYDHPYDEVCIAVVGKYTKLEDAYISVIKSLQHAALACKRKLVINWVEATNLEEETRKSNPVKYHEAWQALCSCHGVLVPGGFGSRGTEGKIQAAAWARKNGRPYLGICLGLQIAVIEFARDVLGWEDANSTEMDPDTTHPVGALDGILQFRFRFIFGKLWQRKQRSEMGKVIDMPEHNPGQMGGTMRLGKRKSVFKNTNSNLKRLYRGADYIEERHRHRYEGSYLHGKPGKGPRALRTMATKHEKVNPALVQNFEERGLKFVATDVDGQRMEVIELEGHPFYTAVQFHPEFLSRPLKPSPPYMGLLLASIGKLDSYLARGCRLSPRTSFADEISSSDEELTAIHTPTSPRTPSPSS